MIKEAKRCPSIVLPAILEWTNGAITPLDKAAFRAKFFYYGSFRTIPFTHGILYNKRVITSPRLILFFWEGAICTHRVDYFINPFNWRKVNKKRERKLKRLLRKKHFSRSIFNSRHLLVNPGDRPSYLIFKAMQIGNANSNSRRQIKSFHDPFFFTCK